MALRVEEVLALWREAERVRDDLPVGHPQRVVVDREIVEIHRLYRRLTVEIESSHDNLHISQTQIESATQTLLRVRAALATAMSPISAAPAPATSGIGAAEPGDDLG